VFIGWGGGGGRGGGVGAFLLPLLQYSSQIQLLAKIKPTQNKLSLSIICNYTKRHKWFCGTFLIF
jgi:hypothetical protein